MPSDGLAMDHNPYQPPQDTHLEKQPSPNALLRREITMQGSMPVRDVLHSQLLILSRRWMYALLCLGLYIGFVLALGLLNPTGAIFGGTFMVLGFIVMPAILPLTLAMVYIRLVRDSKRQIGIFAKTETVLARNGIRSTATNDGVAIPWETFNGFLNSQRVVLLFLKETGNHLIISRTKLTQPDDWDVLLDFLDERFPRR